MTDLARGRELMGLASEGPWTIKAQRGRNGGSGRMFIRAANDYCAVAHVCQRVDRDHNAELIAWAHNNLPALIASAEREAKLRDALELSERLLTATLATSSRDLADWKSDAHDVRYIVRRALAGEK